MRFGCGFGILCVVVVLISGIDYATADGPLAELEPLFTPFPGPRDEGGCDDDLQNLKDSYSQAIVLAEAAIAALRNINEPKPADLKEGQEWDRQARLAKAMFSIDTDPTRGVADKGSRGRQGYTLRHLKSVVKYAHNTSPPKDSTKRVYCTPRFMLFVRNGEATPWGAPIGGAFPHGAFIWKGFGRWATSALPLAPTGDTDPELNICYFSDNREVGARTIPTEHMVIWCESELNGARPTLGIDASDANSKIKEGDMLPQTMSTLWMHELLHVWADGYVQDESVARQNSEGVVTRAQDDGGWSTAYGFAECANLARLVPDDGKENVDSYQVFATVSDRRHAWRTSC
ncbi:MAG: hypothetical protein LQ346_002787 [Caloplaca aetnensis]|nr:MAG: hypothetical protein LQ346_002787 [Caloplaca aetnensis]